MNHPLHTLLLSIGFALSAWAKPNIVLVITDDQGYPEVSAHGNPILKHRTSIDR